MNKKERIQQMIASGKTFARDGQEYSEERYEKALAEYEKAYDLWHEEVMVKGIEKSSTEMHYRAKESQMQAAQIAVTPYECNL